ncbi:MAG: hypothetical protein LBQ79_05545 [Deltaproteobacteria bacterium]|nr:hypothetical protein [Deltaproteobacteria bacterium]
MPAAGTAAVPAEDDPKAFLDPALFARPLSGASDAALSLQELRWCQRQVVRWDLLYRFKPDVGKPEAAEAALARHAKWCGGLPAEGLTYNDMVGPSRSLGLQTVAEALDEARLRNPGLVMVPVFENDLLSDEDKTFTEGEAGEALEVLGMLPEEGGVSFPEALKTFQAALGIPVAGELDALTASLLRNSLFGFSLTMLPWGAGAPDAEAPAPALPEPAEVPAEDDPEAFLDPALYARPLSGASDAALSLQELRRCQRQVVRWDILSRFDPDMREPEAAEAAWARHAKWCGGFPEEGLTYDGMAGPSRSLGLKMVAEALDEARLRNPGLAMHPLLENDLTSDAEKIVTEGEARFALEVLGMLPQEGGGSLPEAVGTFHASLGIPVTGKLDALTASLLRNSVFWYSVEMLPWKRS